MKSIYSLSLLLLFARTSTCAAQDPLLPIVAPPLPTVTIEGIPFGSEIRKKAVVRFGGDSNIERQEKAVVSMMARIIKDYPNLDWYNISYSLPENRYGVLFYNSRARLAGTANSLNGINAYYYNVYPGDFEHISSRNYGIDDTTNEFKALSRRRHNYFLARKKQVLAKKSAPS